MFWSWNEEWEHLGYDLKGCEFKSQTQRLEAMLFQATFYNNYGGGNIYTRGNFEYAKEVWTSIVGPIDAAHGEGMVFSSSFFKQDELRDMVGTLGEFYSGHEQFSFDEDWHQDWECETIQAHVEEWQLPWFRGEMIDVLEEITDWRGITELVPEAGTVALWKVWDDYRDEDQYYEYFESPEDLVVEGAPDPRTAATGLLIEYADSFATAGSPPELDLGGVL